MEKPFDFEDLKKRLLDAGLPEVEDLAEKVYGASHGWLLESCIAHENSYVKALGPVLLGAVDPLVKEQIDKIDKSDNPA